MLQQTLIDAIHDGPIRVTMNDGSQFDIPSPEFAIVDRRSAHVLTKDESEGTMIARILSLACMVSIQKMAPAN